MKWKSTSEGYPPIARNVDVSIPVLVWVENTKHIVNMAVCEYFHHNRKFYICGNSNFEDVEEYFTDWDSEIEELAYVSKWIELPNPPKSQ